MTIRALAPAFWVRRWGLAVGLCLGLAGAQARAAVSIYLSLPGIPGESTDAGHVGWTTVLSWSHWMSKPASGASVHAPLVFTKPLDKGSPTLYVDLCAGTSLSSAELDLIQSGMTTYEFYQLNLSPVLISQVSSAIGSDASENVSLTYRQIAWTYTSVDTQGKPSQTNSATWNLATAKGSYTSGPVGGGGVVDSDGDGIPDWWMNQYFGHPTGLASDNSLANQDADGDGLLNWQEYIAGTDPTSANSVFRVSKINLASGQVRVTWNSVAGKTYSLYGASSIKGPYALVVSGIASAGTGTTSYDLPNAGAFQFFRVSVP